MLTSHERCSSIAVHDGCCNGDTYYEYLLASSVGSALRAFNRDDTLNLDKLNWIEDPKIIILSQRYMFWIYTTNRNNT